MLFHSSAFLFVFLPALLAAYHVLGRYGRQWELFVLLAASLVFYAFWSIPFLAILLLSATLNFSLGRWLRAERGSRRGRWILAGGIAANLVLLGYFKYANFFVDTINAFLAAPMPLQSLWLPIGISFYTFQQIIYLVDVYNEDDQPVTFFQYLLFVVFFAYVTSGPITRQNEIVPQFNRPSTGIDAQRVLVAAALFAFGLFKKLVVADNLAPSVNTVFDAAAGGAALTSVDAWLGATLFLFQLYFDFSGYCDMAMALGYLFGIALPLNFNSPLQAKSAIEFWQRWHITLTRTITNYIYMPIAIRVMRKAQRYRLGKTSHFLVAVAFPLLATFLIAGLWHGAGWTFVVFGLIWGIALTLNHAWRTFGLPPLPPALGWALTIGVAVVSMVFFRADNLVTAAHVLQAMFGATAAVTSVLPIALPAVVAIGLFLLALTAPNAPQIMRGFPVSTDQIERPTSNVASLIAWQYRAVDVALIALLLLVAALSSGDSSQFLYYKF